MIEINEYIKNIENKLKQKFGSRLLYLGLQGSYMRNEATENSDIDLMVIVDDLIVNDLKNYKNIILFENHYEKSCGFISGKEEMLHWNPLEICHLKNTTKDIFGKLSDFLPEYTQTDQVNYIKLSLNNLYHELCHRYIHSDIKENIASLPYTYKNVFFILQNIYFIKNNVFITTKKELTEKLVGDDKLIMKTAVKLSETPEYDFDDAYNLIFSWCQKKILTFDI